MEARVVNPNIAPSRILIKAAIYKLNQTLDYKLNKTLLMESNNNKGFIVEP